MFFLEYFESFFGNFYVIFVATSLSFFLKTCFLFAFVKRLITHSNDIKRILLLLILLILGSAIPDAAWMVKLFRDLFFPMFDYRIVLFVIRIAWIFFIIQYHALSLFLENLAHQQYILPMRQKICIMISALFCMFFVVVTIVDFNCTNESQIMSLHVFLQNLSTFYCLFFLFLPSLFIIVQKIRSNQLPAILQAQLKIFLQWLIIPHYLTDCIQMFPFKIYSLDWIAHSYATVGFSTLFLAVALYFCARRILRLRFLNLRSHVQQPMNVNFIDDFKGVLERLSVVTSFSELGYIIQNFFKETFVVAGDKTRFYLRNFGEQVDKRHDDGMNNSMSYVVETFFETHGEFIASIVKQEKALIYDEIAFSHFYDTCQEGKVMLQFLDLINADVFLPIYEKDKLIAYIIIERGARSGKFYSDVERNEFIVFGSYLGNIINLLQKKNLDVLVEQEQILRKELHHKHQEIEQYKESIRSFLRTHVGQKIGILFYKNRHFIYGNKEAKELINIDFDRQQGHPLGGTLRHLAQQVEDFKSPHTVFAKDTAGNTLVFSAVTHLEQNTVIITISRPDISDTIKYYLDVLKDPTEWDYVLYLQTTRSGKLINQLVPGDGPTLLHFKIELLKTALSQKALYVETSDQDLLPTVELVHAVSMREKLHVISLQPQHSAVDVAITLFGINPIFGLHRAYERPLLEQLDTIGTLFIKNIHLLDIEAQEHLAEFIRYGYFKVLKSNQKIASNVRIICSGNNIMALVHEGKFSKVLFDELRSTILSMPSLLTLSEGELSSLTDGFIQQHIGSQELHNMFSLTDKEKYLLLQYPSASLQELKARVQNILAKKSHKNQIYHEAEFVPAEITDPEFIALARLGKRALKDQKVMTLLWNKFKNQNKISLFLNVNRSSVNRRCKEYNLL